MRSPRTAPTLFANPYTTSTQPTINPRTNFQAPVSQSYEYYNPYGELPQRQQQNPTPLSQRPSSAGVASVRSLRRTPRLQERRVTTLRAPEQAFSTPAPIFPGRARDPLPKKQAVAFAKSGSTTPQSFQNLVQDESYWPKRTTRISRRTHEAILFALEAVRSGRGVDAIQLTTVDSEEEARMSEMFLDDPMSNRPQGARPAPSDTAAQARIQTPQQIMAARRQREANKRAEQEARQRQPQDINTTRRRPQEEVVGVGADPRSQQARPAYTEPDNPARLHAGQSVTIGGRSDNIPTTNGAVPRPGNAFVNQGQPRPVQGQQYNQPDNPAQIQRDRTEAFEKLSMPAVAGTKGPQPQDPEYPQPTTSSQPSRSGFPHAFERWETLSSHWEGLTSYWIRRLQENTNELDGKPIDKQMARQITDLSAAGANLFHAVVELQRLRASSERKFQRWFFETRNEQEQAQERIAELQAQLQAERQNRTQATQSSAPTEALRAEKAKADELVREMRRELQISKEEARRAWEELGRREQEERERTVALRSGEPTLIGGVQVLPMQGLTSRHNTTASNRPVTRDGPYPGGPGATSMGGQYQQATSQTSLESPVREEHRFHYRREATSPTDTDPFTEPTRPIQHPLRHEPDTRFLASPRGQPSQTSQQSLSAPRMTSASPAQSHQSAQNRMNVAEQRSYVQSSRSRSGDSVQSEEEYHVGPDGQYIRDAQGRPIPYDEPIGGYEDVASDDDDHTADVQNEEMLVQQYARRHEASRHASPGQANLPAASRSPQPGPSPAYAQASTTPRTQRTAYHEDSPADILPTSSSTISPSTPQQPLTGRLTSPLQEPVDYEGAAYGEEDPSYQAGATPPGNAPRHHVPTRLSDILEERTSSVISSGSNQNQAYQQYPYSPPYTSANPNNGTRR